MFQYSIRDSQPIYTQRDALKLLASLTKGKDVINVIDILNNNFIPHYTTYNEKSIFWLNCVNAVSIKLWASSTINVSNVGSRPGLTTSLNNNA